MQTDELLTELEVWAQDDAKIEPKDFRCSYYDACNASVRGGLRGGDTCAMSYVGKRYSRQSANNAEPRLVIPGIDHGEPSGGGTTYQRGREYIESIYIHEGRRFNSHYRGVERTAAAFLGKTGNHCLINCKSRCARSLGAASDTCVLDRLVQPNLVKCVPVTAPNMSSVTTGLMRINCSHHLVAELRILKPDIVVFHGAKAQPIMLSRFIEDGIKCNSVVNNNKGNTVLYYASELNSYMVFLHHPSRYRMDSTWDRDAVPSLDYLKKEGVIPV